MKTKSRGEARQGKLQGIERPYPVLPRLAYEFSVGYLHRAHANIDGAFVAEVERWKRRHPPLPWSGSQALSSACGPMLGSARTSSLNQWQ